MNVVLDTSVAIAWYLNEAFSDEARAWQDRILRGRNRAIVPGLHFLEFANVLRTYTRRSELDARLAEDIYELHLEAPIDIVEPPRQKLLCTALEYEATLYDAAYILLAQTCECALVTAERTTTPWVNRLGDTAISIRA